MGLVEKIKKKINEGMKEGLDEVYKTMVKYDPLYKQALKAAKTQAALDKINDKDVEEAFGEIAQEEREKAKKKMEGKSLTLEVLMVNGDGTQLVLPVKQRNRSQLAKDLLAHVLGVFDRYSVKPKIGKQGSYVTLSTKYELEHLATEIQDVPEAMGLANIDIQVVPLVLPGNGVEYTANPKGRRTGKSLTLGITHSSMKWYLIPVPVEDRGFFPREGKEFELESPAGVVKTHRNRGRIVGGLRPVLESLGVKKGDSVKIYAVEPKKRYRISKV